MKVVLLKDLKGKGKKGDIIEISSGYAQNYLIPQGLAKLGTSSNLNEANQAKKAQEYREICYFAHKRVKYQVKNYHKINRRY